MMRRVVMAMVVLALVASAAQAQDVIPTQYRVTRTGGAAVAPFVFLKSEMSCGVPKGMLADIGIQIDDPQDPARDCNLLSAGNWPVGLPANITYQWTIAGSANGINWGPESAPYTFGVPAAPGNLRVRPGQVGVSAEATILTEPYRLAVPGTGLLEVVTARLTSLAPGVLVHLGTASFASRGYTVRRGDVFEFVLRRPY